MRWKEFFHLLICLWILVSPAFLKSQILIDDFENDLSNWTVLEGNAEIQGANEFRGANAVRLFRRITPSGGQITLLHNTFQENFGIYEMACFADGMVSDIQFIFQYLDDQNYYQVTCNPRNTDNPYLLLFKVEDGDHILLDSIGPVVDLNQWFILRVERYCDGSIDVYIDDLLKIQVTDRSILQPGTIGLGAWAESSYFDALTFDPVTSDIVVDLDTFVCSGRFFELAEERYNESGFYIDTLQTAQGCDSIIRLQLTIVPHYLVTARDTICAHEYQLFDGDTLRTGGRYNAALQSIHGCDSLVELNLIVLGGDTMSSDTSICQGEFLVFSDDTIFESGRYFDTIFAPDGCFGIVELNVEVGLPSLNLGEDQTVCFENTPDIMLQVSGFDSIRWFDGSTVDAINVNAPGIYWVEVFQGNCSATDTIEIFEFCLPKTEAYIPNAFSPNGDQVNDIFTASFPQKPTSFRMFIFNRWGNQIFQTDNEDYGWDGTVHGKTEPSGVYLYVVEIDGRQYTGTVNLIR